MDDDEPVRFLSSKFNYRVLDDDPETPIHTLRPPSAFSGLHKSLKKNRSFDRESIGFQASDEGDSSREEDSIDESPVYHQRDTWENHVDRSKRILSTTWIPDDISPQIQIKPVKIETDDDLESQTTMKSSVKFVNGLPTVVTKDKPHKFYCIVCHYEGMTRMSYVMSKSLVMLSVVFLFTLFWPCMLFAVFSNRWKDIVHYCPKCNHVVGKRKVDM